MEAINKYYEWINEECPIEIISFKEADGCSEFIGVDGEMYFILDYEDYFQAYGVNFFTMAWVEEYWEDVAFFFVRDEAVKYTKYQSHNLHHPRVFSHHLGYANQGDLPHFYELLMKMSNQLKYDSGK